jgi:hypothetical protein
MIIPTFRRYTNKISIFKIPRGIGILGRYLYVVNPLAHFLKQNQVHTATLQARVSIVFIFCFCLREPESYSHPRFRSLHASGYLSAIDTVYVLPNSRTVRCSRGAQMGVHRVIVEVVPVEVGAPSLIRTWAHASTSTIALVQANILNTISISTAP